ncbi:MAG: hypothetical protein JNL11_10440 [Bdellovibrionaceae bacterium]|nr:hypothetical protein [Pseudobdellovibrionaceae bacterium]
MLNKLTHILAISLISASAALAVCPTGTDSLGTTNAVERCALKGKYLSTQLTLTSINEYVIVDGVFFGGDNTQNSKLIIEPGTKIMGLPGSFIVIMRGSQIVAQGTAKKPIVFTSAQAQPKRGDWGGLVLNGNAPINACKTGVTVCEAISEGIKVEAVKFGGDNAKDNSGILKYVRVEFGGYPISPDNELNGITFNGVGSETLVENIQVHMNADDGIEFFGGTVNAKYVVLSSNEDDSLDWDMGWVGNIQHLLIDQGTDAVDNGIEADNLKSPMNAMPRSNPTISNMTIIGSPKSAYGMLLRRGTGATILNSIITGTGKAAINIDDAETFAHGAKIVGTAVYPEGLKIQNSVAFSPKNFEFDAKDLWSTEAWFNAQPGNSDQDPQLQGYMPKANSPVLKMGVSSDNLFFDAVSHVGAFAKKDWTQGWTRK